MRIFCLFFILIPCILYGESTDSTYIKLNSLKSEFEIEENKTKLKFNFFTPSGNPSNKKDVVLIIGKDTLCYNSIYNQDTLLNVNSGVQTIEIRSKWFQSTKQKIKLTSQTFAAINIFFGEKIMSLPHIEYNYNKPIIYFYPEKKQQIEAKLELNGKLNFTYPKYKDGWYFTASPNGNITLDNKSYNYLFWEGTVSAENSTFNQKEGFIVSSDTLLLFFERTLSKLGLSSQEQQDFITYWYPLMIKNSTNYIHFIFNEEYNQIATLNVKPKPDNMIRLFMFWKNIDNHNNTNITKQSLPHYNRNGFTIVEWGGAEIPENILSFSK